jgi:hypothetical protein
METITKLVTSWNWLFVGFVANHSSCRTPGAGGQTIIEALDGKIGQDYQRISESF